MASVINTAISVQYDVIYLTRHIFISIPHITPCSDVQLRMSLNGVIYTEPYITSLCAYSSARQLRYLMTNEWIKDRIDFMWLRTLDNV